MISDELTKALNDQVQQELQASMMYLGMASYLRDENWDGFAQFAEDQAQEEREHAKRIYEFMNEVNKKVEFRSLEQPQNNYESVIAVFEEALEQEKANSQSFNKIQKIANRNDDFQAQTMIQWFIDEQIEEENHIESILDQIQRLEGDEKFLFNVDQDLGAELG